MNNETYNNDDEDRIITAIGERDDRLKFAVWDYMEFLSEEMRIDNPEKVIDTIRDAIEEYFLEYYPMDERFDD